MAAYTWQHTAGVHCQCHGCPQCSRVENDPDVCCWQNRANKTKHFHIRDQRCTACLSLLEIIVPKAPQKAPPTPPTPPTQAAFSKPPPAKQPTRDSRASASPAMSSTGDWASSPAGGPQVWHLRLQPADIEDLRAGIRNDMNTLRQQIADDTDDLVSPLQTAIAELSLRLGQ